jgi:hypothetical protein
MRALSSAAIHERLGARLRILASRDRDVEERQRTLEATIAWSYDLLDDDERRVLRGLSVFAGGCTLAAAEAVAGADLDSIESLLDKSLVRHRMDEAGQDRYWMLETIREYAQQELEREAEGDAAGTRHTAYFADLAVRVDAASTYVMSDEQRDLYVSDRANFDEAHARALASGDGASALRFVRRLGRATQVTGLRARDWYARCAASIALPGGARDDRAWALVRTARIAVITGEFAQARSWLDEADALLEQLEDWHGSADALGARCVVELSTGDFDQAFELAERLAALARVLDDVDRAGAESEAEWALAYALLGRALVDDDRSLAERSRALFAASADAAAGWPLYDQAGAQQNLAYCLFVLGDYSNGIATGLRALGKLVAPEATVESENQLVSECLYAIGISLCGTSEADIGVKLVSSVRRMYRENGVAEWALDREILRRVEKLARPALGDDGYETAVRRGEVMTREEAIELALKITAD